MENEENKNENLDNLNIVPPIDDQSILGTEQPPDQVSHAQQPEGDAATPNQINTSIPQATEQPVGNLCQEINDDSKNLNQTQQPTTQPETDTDEITQTIPLTSQILEEQPLENQKIDYHVSSNEIKQPANQNETDLVH